MTPVLRTARPAVGARQRNCCACKAFVAVPSARTLAAQAQAHCARQVIRARACLPRAPSSSRSSDRLAAATRHASLTLAAAPDDLGLRWCGLRAACCRVAIVDSEHVLLFSAPLAHEKCARLTGQRKAAAPAAAQAEPWLRSRLRTF